MTEKRIKSLTIRCTEGDLDEIRAAAAAARRSVSQFFVIKALVAARNRRPDEQPFTAVPEAEEGPPASEAAPNARVTSPSGDHRRRRGNR